MTPSDANGAARHKTKRSDAEKSVRERLQQEAQFATNAVIWSETAPCPRGRAPKLLFTSQTKHRSRLTVLLRHLPPGSQIRIEVVLAIPAAAQADSAA